MPLPCLESPLSHLSPVLLSVCYFPRHVDFPAAFLSPRCPSPPCCVANLCISEAPWSFSLETKRHQMTPPTTTPVFKIKTLACGAITIPDQPAGGAEAPAWSERHAFAFELLIDLLCVCVVCAVVLCEWFSCLCGAAHRPGPPPATPTVPSPSRPPQAARRHVRGGTVGRGRASLIGRLRVTERC